MFGIEQRGEVLKHVNNTLKVIKLEVLRTTCKFMSGKETCRYISKGIYGFVCVKNSPLRSSLDKLVEDKSMAATGDNCCGL